MVPIDMMILSLFISGGGSSGLLLWKGEVDSGALAREPLSQGAF